MAQAWEVTAVGADPEALERTLEEAGARIEARTRGREVVRLRVRGDLGAERPALLRRARQEGYDLAIAPSAGGRSWRLAVLDMDSTVIAIEVIDELARAAGRYEEVAKITERAMRGDLDFSQSLRARVALLAGTPVEVLDRIAANLPLNEGAERMVRGLHAMGVKVAVLSGGFLPAARALQARLGLDHVHANQLEVREGRFTGGLVGPIVDGDRKA
ncbi:MAG TPA: phosphoserine phosphatase SerB, partial [Fredinandcohnia sp.]|nr:phosphoserine phosphatase SerB [Fredinandcohnia sp.]